MNNPSPSSIPLDDPRYPIFGRLFMCKVPKTAQYGTDYLKTYGIPTSGYKDVDLALFTKPQLCYITINQMVEYYHENQVIAIVKQDDVRTIYEICQDYTFDWAKRIKDSIYYTTAPYQDLIKIDEFAEAVYQYAGYTYGKEFARSFIADFGGDELEKEILSLHQMYDTIENKKVLREKRKHAELTVTNKYSTIRSEAEEKLKIQQKEKELELPDRPSVRDIFTHYMKV